MAKHRYINTRFWADNFVVELNPLDKYLFIYLLTNDKTDICGIYELPIKTMANETGLDKEMLEKMIKRLEGKIYYLDGWVYVKNFTKHLIMNESVQKGIERSLKIVPKEIMAKIKSISEEGGTDSDRLGQTGTDCHILIPIPIPILKNTRTKRVSSSSLKSKDKPPIGVGDAMKELISWAEERRGAKFINFLKQMKALSNARKADISPSRLKNRWVDMEKDKFWKEKGFDWMNVISSFDKKP